MDHRPLIACALMLAIPGCVDDDATSVAIVLETAEPGPAIEWQNVSHEGLYFLELATYVRAFNGTRTEWPSQAELRSDQAALMQDIALDYPGSKTDGRFRIHDGGRWIMLSFEPWD